MDWKKNGICTLIPSWKRDIIYVQIIVGEGNIYIHTIVEEGENCAHIYYEQIPFAKPALADSHSIVLISMSKVQITSHL